MYNVYLEWTALESFYFFIVKHDLHRELLVIHHCTAKYIVVSKSIVDQ